MKEKVTFESELTEVGSLVAPLSIGSPPHIGVS
jgi:hypothetical protein